MGSDSSKEESRSSPEQSQRRNQHARQHRRQEPSYQHQSPPPQAPAERRAPYSYTSEHLQTAVKESSPNVLERPRAPYNYNSQQLQYGSQNSQKSPNLYPNLDAHVDGYVYVQRSPQPSAPPASEVLASPKVPPRPSQPPASRESPRPPTPQTSTVPKIPPTARPLVSEINTVPKIPPATRPMSELSTVTKIPPTTRPLVSQIGTLPSIPATRSPTPVLNRSPNIPTTSKAAAPVMSTMGLCTPTLQPPVSELNTMPKTSPISRDPLNLFNVLEIPATQSFNTCKAEVKIPPLISPQPQQSTSSPTPGPSQAANYSANNNSRPAARNRGNKDSYSCPTCGQRLGLTIYQCLGGHSSCKDCRLAGRQCGTCLSAITDMRNISLEAFMAELTTPCQSPGCTLSFKTCDMERHLKECPFGEIDCPMGMFFGQCSTRCKVADLASHFDACHREQRTAEIDKEMYVFNLCMETHKLYLIKNGPFTFLVHLKVHEKERKISMVVQLLGTNMSAGKWTYEFHVYNKRQPLRKFLYVDSCQSIGTPIAEIFNENQCATLPLTYAMTFVNESALTYKFYIKKQINQRGRRPRNNAAR